MENQLLIIQFLITWAMFNQYDGRYRWQNGIWSVVFTLFLNLLVRVLAAKGLLQ